jgi:hypothetical protein
MSSQPSATQVRLGRLTAGTVLAAYVFIALITAGVLPVGLH